MLYWQKISFRRAVQDQKSKDQWVYLLHDQQNLAICARSFIIAAWHYATVKNLL